MPTARVEPEFDDDFEVTLEWLEAISQANGEPLSMFHFYTSAELDGKFHHVVRSEWQPDGSHMYISPEPATHGSVRMLAAVLGIQLREPLKARIQKGTT
jgi:hypothetical protein